MVMGSEGRGEQTLATDQDNAIVYENVEEKGWRAPFSTTSLKWEQRVNRDLDRVGYNYCKGDIMAKNPKWTQPLATWKNYFYQWLSTGNPQDILEAAIFFDFRYVYGEQSMVEELRDHVTEISDNKSVFFYHMAQSVLKFKPPVNIFGNIVGDESRSDELNLDIKKVMLPVITFIRLYSIREKITNTNSLERLGELFFKKYNR